MMSYLYADKIQMNIPSQAVPILFETTLSIARQEFVVILGHNGSGKSTLVKLLAGDVMPTKGTVKVDGTPLNLLSPSQKAIKLITLTQRPEDRLFLELTLQENIMLWESRFPATYRLTPKQVLELTNTTKRFLSLLHQPLHTFSGGEKQTILLALALAHPPSILFLDEHTSSLDPKAAHEVMLTTASVIEKYQITALMVTHHLEDAVNYGNRLIILHEGKVVLDKKKTEKISVQELRETMEFGV